MKGLVFDINIQGLSEILLRSWRALDIWEFWLDLELPIYSIPELGLDRNESDRVIWNHCQNEGFVLVTDNRKSDGIDSLGQTIADSNQPNSLPVLTIGNRGRFQQERSYTLLVAKIFLETLLDIGNEKLLGAGRIMIPKQAQ